MSLQQQRALAAGFHSRKKAILIALNSDTPDKSPKGYVDEPLLPLIVLINNHPDYVTTSSCSGRICTYLEGMEEGDEDEHGKESTEDEKEETEDQDVKGYAENTSLAAVEAAKRAKGGQWLYVSHDPVEWPSFSADQKALERKWIIETLFGPEAHRVVLMKGDSESDEKTVHIQGDDQDDIAKAQLVYFKFEPMILHIESSTPAAAKIFLNHSLFSGYRNSGILPSAKRTMLAIRSTLKLDAPIAYIIPGNSTSITSASESAHKIQLMVTLSYLRVLLQLSNDKFVSNVAQMARFEIRLKEHLLKNDQGGETCSETDGKTGDQGAWEDKDARRERKRREGLEKKSAAAAAKAEAEAAAAETEPLNDNQQQTTESAMDSTKQQ